MRTPESQCTRVKSKCTVWRAVLSDDFNYVYHAALWENLS